MSVSRSSSRRSHDGTTSFTAEVSTSRRNLTHSLHSPVALPMIRQRNDSFRPIQRNHSVQGFYGGRNGHQSSDDEGVWQPGELIPTTPQNEANGMMSSSEVYELFVEMKTCISREINHVHSSIEELSKRVGKLEGDVATHLSSAGETTPSSGSSVSLQSDSTTPKRKRRVPVDLANTVRIVHNNLPAAKMLKVDESIDSEHNRNVLNLVAKEICTEGKFSASDIKKSLSQYRKMLVRKPKESEDVVESRKRRARKQRKFERRGSKVVGDEEQRLWNELTVSMMSDEEDIGEDTFKVHRPHWRSDELNTLLDELDARANADPANKGHPRKNRVPSSWLLNNGW